MTAVSSSATSFALVGLYCVWKNRRVSQILLELAIATWKQWTRHCRFPWLAASSPLLCIEMDCIEMACSAVHLRGCIQLSRCRGLLRVACVEDRKRRASQSGGELSSESENTSCSHLSPTFRLRSFGLRNLVCCSLLSDPGACCLISLFAVCFALCSLPVAWSGQDQVVAERRWTARCWNSVRCTLIVCQMKFAVLSHFRC